MQRVSREKQMVKTYSIAFEIRHLVSLVQVLRDRCLAASCWAGNDPDVLVL